MADFVRARFDDAIPRAWLEGLEDRAEKMQPAAPDLVAVLHRGVQRQFLAQAEFLKKGRRRRWRPSQRALREGGLTLVDTGQYVRAWTGRGPGSVTRADKDGVRVGVNPTRFPQVRVFQGRRTVRGVVPRRVGMSKAMLESSSKIMVNHILGRRS